MSTFAGIDLGTRSARCLVVDERGARIALGERAWNYRTDDFGFPFLDPEEAFAAVAGAIDDAGARDVTAAGITSQRHGTAFLDDAGAELMLVPNFDARALQEALAMQAEHAEELYATTGRLLMMLGVPARLAWMRARRPDDAARARMALSFSGWLGYRLTGVAGSDRTLAVESMLCDTNGTPSERLLDAFDVTRAMLPPITEPGDVLGGARALFADGTPVVIAGADTQCALLALGVLDAGEACVVAGTTMLAGVVRADAARDETKRTWTSPHAIDGRFLREAHCWEAGPAVEWIARLFGCSPAEFADIAARGVPGSGGIAFVDPTPSDASNFPMLRTGGLFFTAALLVLAREREDVARAVFEGIAFGARAGLEWIEPFTSVAVAGGVARSEVFRAALAGSLGRTIRVATEPHSSALGAAIAAAASHHGGVREAVDAMRDRGRDVAPNDDHGYAAHYGAWRARATDLDAKTMRMSDFTR